MMYERKMEAAEALACKVCGRSCYVALLSVIMHKCFRFYANYVTLICGYLHNLQGQRETNTLYPFEIRVARAYTRAVM
ncbi:LOW QUALITY PROTEIN: hypothetical protein U9M48_001081 [Paspalum notatum var. saurae]|uniref:Uncharacterized protein n=1 Tax=Paspalum notatum var. saurae TaxID=547442 RepID=A0AAQ3PHS2_PASNO